MWSEGGARFYGGSRSDIADLRRCREFLTITQDAFGVSSAIGRGNQERILDDEDVGSASHRQDEHVYNSRFPSFGHGDVQRHRAMQHNGLEARANARVRAATSDRYVPNVRSFARPPARPSRKSRGRVFTARRIYSTE